MSEGEGGEGQKLVMSVLTQLLILAIVILAVSAWLYSQSGSTRFITEFYKRDMALTEDVVKSFPGDVDFYYSNIRSDAPLKFFFSRGELALGKISTGEEDLPLVTTGSGEEKVVASKKYYWYSFSEDEEFVETEVEAPKFLLFSKSGNTFTVTKELSFSMCDKPSLKKPPFIKSEDDLFLKTVEQFLERDKREITLPPKEKAPIIFRFKVAEKKNGEEKPAVGHSVSKEFKDVSAFKCRFKNYLTEELNLGKVEEYELEEEKGRGVVELKLPKSFLNVRKNGDDLAKKTAELIKFSLTAEEEGSEDEKKAEEGEGNG